MALLLRGDRARSRRRRTSKQTLTHVLTGAYAGCDKRRFLDAVREQSVPRDNVPSSIRPLRDRSATLRPSWHACNVQKYFHPRRWAPGALVICPEAWYVAGIKQKKEAA